MALSAMVSLSFPSRLLTRTNLRGQFARHLVDRFAGFLGCLGVTFPRGALFGPAVRRFAEAVDTVLPPERDASTAFLPPAFEAVAAPVFDGFDT
ncbi:MAG: hypothetical protein B7Z74_09105, partial [Deltaproteobacteria bacterium 21-66-5]